MEEKLDILTTKQPAGSDASINRLVVVGGGRMGQGIAQAAAKKGIDVLLVEQDKDLLAAAMNQISERLDREISRWALTASEKKSILSKINGTVELKSITNEQVILEAIPENFDLKKSLFRELDKHCKSQEAIFITNTSTLSITEIASSLNRPDHLIGMHFLNPVHKSRVVELVRGLKTSSATYNKALTLAKKLEIRAIEVYESPGYVTTRVMLPFINEAVHVLMEGVASAEDIDAALQLGYDLSNGPLAMADSMGLDSVLNWLDSLFRDLGDPKYRPCPLLKMLVRAGHLGVKTRQGFFRYDEEGRMIPGSGQTAAYEKFSK